MCVAIPVRVVEIQGSKGLIELGGLSKEIELCLTPDVQKGHYVLLHAGFAIRIIDEDESRETLRLLEGVIEASR